MTVSVAALTADIVGSRGLADRSGAQAAIERAVAVAHAALPHTVLRDTGATRPLAPTVGDELQGVYAGVRDALAVVLVTRLALPDGVECRFGIGLGAIVAVPSVAGELSEGPAWWAARAAIDAVHERARRAQPALRVRVQAALGAADDDAVALANAYASSMDELLAGAGGRARRLVLGRILGRTQRELAEAEGITQSAVSQGLQAAGAAGILASLAALTAEAS